MEIIDKDEERIMKLHKLGVNPFAMGYIDFNVKDYKVSKNVKDFCRWVNHKAIFKSVKWQDYKS